ncbi:MAG: TonB-dependent receptor [Bacteroidales bacterium]|nr:TonB-dependent receptor [Bacteroidales bacterium]
MKKLLLTLSVFCLAAAGMNAQTDTTETTKLDEVVVTGTRSQTDIRHLPITVSVVTEQQLREENEQNVLPVVSQNVPGVFITDRGILGYGVSTNSSGSIRIRGIGSMANMLVLIDGLPQYAGLYGHPIADVYQTMMTEKVELLRGPASVIYGSNAMGGVMNIVTHKMKEQGMKTRINHQIGSYGTVQTSFVNSFRKNKFSSIVGLNYGQTDGHRDNMDFNQMSGFLKLGYDFSNNWALNGDLNVSHFNSANPGEENNPIFDNRMHVTRGMAALNLTNEYERMSGAVHVFYNWGHHKINDGYYTGGSPRTSLYYHNDLMGGVSLYESFHLFKGNTFTIGADYMTFGGEAWNETIADQKKTTIIDKTENEKAVYADFRQMISSFLILDAGVRFDDHSQAGDQIVPQGGITLLLPKQSEIRALVSKGFRNPTIREMYMYAPANDELNAEKLMNYEISYKQRLFNDRLRYGINVFYLKADNLIETVMTDGKPKNINTGEVENWGIEGEINYVLNKHLRFNTNYSYLNMKNPIVAAPEHKFYFGGQYRYRQFSVMSGVQYINGLYTKVGNDEQKENFVLWNATATYQPVDKLNLFIKAENILNKVYYINYGFPMPKTTVSGGINVSF